MKKSCGWIPLLDSFCLTTYGSNGFVWELWECLCVPYGIPLVTDCLDTCGPFMTSHATQWPLMEESHILSDRGS